jgi:hypothetical protein
VPLTCRGRANGAGPELAGTVRHGRGHNIRGLLCVYPVSLHPSSDPIVPVCIVRIRRCELRSDFGFATLMSSRTRR